MPTPAEYRRLARRGGIDRFAGLPPQFEHTGTQWLFRRHGHGPALPLSDEEHAGFMRAGLWAVILHFVALPLSGWLAWLVLERALPGWSTNALAALFGVVLSSIALGLWGSLRHQADAPTRALAGRAAVAPSRDPSDAAQPSWTTIIAVTLVLLFMAATGTRQPPAVYIAFASASVMLGVTLALRRVNFQAGLTVAQRERLRDQARVARAAERRKVQPEGSLWQLPLFLLFIVVELAVLVLGVAIGVTVSIGIAAIVVGPASELSFGVFIAGFIPGIILGALMNGPVDRLCKRWTGGSAAHAFDWVPPGW